MRFDRSRDADDTGIDLVPLIDVMLVLVIFFVVAARLDAGSLLQLQLPTASQQPAAPPTGTLQILVNAQGRYFINDRELLGTDPQDLQQALADAAGQQRDQVVLLRADARTPYQSVVTVQDALGQLGFARIAIATAPESP